MTVDFLLRIVKGFIGAVGYFSRKVVDIIMTDGNFSRKFVFFLEH